MLLHTAISAPKAYWVWLQALLIESVFRMRGNKIDLSEFDMWPSLGPECRHPSEAEAENAEVFEKYCLKVKMHC